MVDVLVSGMVVVVVDTEVLDEVDEPGTELVELLVVGPDGPLLVVDDVEVGGTVDVDVAEVVVDVTADVVVEDAATAPLAG